MFRGLPTASLPLLQLFANPYLFTVPVYQRPYSWTIKEAAQLLEDVSKAAGLDTDEPATPDYFLGTILLLDPEADGTAPPPPFSAPRVFEVIDGQQRIVTLAILASILRDLEDAEAVAESQPEANALAIRLDAMVSVARDDRDITARRTRIRLHDGEQAFLEPHVLVRHAKPREPDDETSEGNGIKPVHDQLRQELAALSRPERQRLARFLIEDCHVVVIITRDIDSAHRLFSVLNERGRPLDRNDILKVEVLRKIPAGLTRESLDLWQQARGKLGAEFEDLFSYICSIHGNPKLPIIAAVRALIRDHGSEQFLENILAPLADGVQLVRQHAEFPQIAQDTALTAALVSLNRLGNIDWLPAAALAMVGFQSEATRATASALMVEIERFEFIMRVLGLGFDKRQRRFAPVIAAIRSNPATAIASGVFEFTRDEQRTAVYHLKDLHRRNTPLTKLLLMRIEEAVTGQRIEVDPSLLSVEHVLPTRPSASSNWRLLFPDSVVREACQGSLGNLALVTLKQNERAKNKDFAEKLAVYREAGPGVPRFKTNEAIMNASAWRADTIAEREQAMLDILAGIWRLDFSTGGGNGR